MCGIAGFFSPKGHRATDAKQLTVVMTDAITHRGPDAGGVFATDHVGLGHRRLSILDLSDAGAQPMTSHDGRYIIVFNGEIYNFADLKAQLNTTAYQGHSDTEILLEGFCQWGIEETCKRANGMFGFAVWDTVESRLTLGRDRMGKKPLYFAWLGHSLGFASELHALRAHPDFNQSIDRDALDAYLRFSVTPGVRSIYKGVSRVEPGGLRHFDLDSRPKSKGRLTRYWSPNTAVREGAHDRDTIRPAKWYVDELAGLLRDATKVRMESDVPLGAFLSGGIDSSLVVALMQSISKAPVETFSIGFQEARFNEAQHASLVAKHLGTKHTELYVSAQDTLDVIPKLPQIYDEPFADSSQVPTYLVSKMAREHVTVALSGDGGDELFAGYHRYSFAEKLWAQVKHPVARKLISALAFAPKGKRAALLSALTPLLPARAQGVLNQDRMLLASELTHLNNHVDFHRYMLSQWREPDPIVTGIEKRTLPPMFGADTAVDLANVGETASYVDMLSYLVDDILVKVDRASMAVSLEARAPLLDYRVAEFAWKTPYSIKTLDGLGKWPLRELVYRFIPRAIMERPKQGFGVPIEEWLRGSLKPWAADLLSEERLKRGGYFNVPAVTRRWKEHQQGHRNWSPDLWSILMFEAFRDHVGIA